MSLALLGGLSGAVVLTAAAGARRTASSVDRLTSSTNASDVVMLVSGLDAATVAAVTELPMVAEFAFVDVMSAAVEGGPPGLALLAPRDDTFLTAIERDRVLRGRRADPGRLDEVVVNERGAYLGVGVGDRLTIAAAPDQGSSQIPSGAGRWVVEVVGITRELADLDQNGEPGVTGTPALWNALGGESAAAETVLAIGLADETRPADFDRAAQSLLSPGAGGDFPAMPLHVLIKPARTL